MSLRCNKSLGLALGLLAGAFASPALGSNGNKPRVQVRWTPGEHCIQTLDKATQSNLHFTYDFDGPDDLVPSDSKDEVPDSRRHQFFASCRHRHRQELLPRWISRADFDRSKAFGFPIIDPGPERILETSTDWSRCTLRINADAQRVPITHAQAQAGVHWDISSIPTGTYVIDAYTWEPPENLWTSPSRPGAIRVWDSRQEASPPPAAAITAQASIGFVNQAQTIQGCIQAQPGSTMTWSVASLPPLGVPANWTSLDTPSPVVSGPLEWSFMPPPLPEGVGVGKWMLRLTVQDPSGREYHAYSRSDLLVLDPSVDPEFIYEPPPKEQEPGCRAQVSGANHPWPWLLGLLFLLPAPSMRRKDRSPDRIR